MVENYVFYRRLSETPLLASAVAVHWDLCHLV